MNLTAHVLLFTFLLQYYVVHSMPFQNARREDSQAGIGSQESSVAEDDNQPPKVANTENNVVVPDVAKTENNDPPDADKSENNDPPNVSKPDNNERSNEANEDNKKLSNIAKEDNKKLSIIAKEDNNELSSVAKEDVSEISSAVKVDNELSGITKEDNNDLTIVANPHENEPSNVANPEITGGSSETVNKEEKRSAPEADNADAVPNASLDAQSNIHPGKYLNPFNLADQVSDLFKSKGSSGKKAAKGRQKIHGHSNSDKFVNMKNQDDMIDPTNPLVAADEQKSAEESEMETTGNQLDNNESGLRGGASSICGSGGRPSWKNQPAGQLKGVGIIEVMSLYSNPIKVDTSRLKVRQRNKNTLTRPETPQSEEDQPSLSHHGRVMRPINSNPQFPVYDEDLDFVPDPLQGILDDKYWNDPSEQESVIKKYTNMAANIASQAADSSDSQEKKEASRIKSVSSDLAFSGVDTGLKDLSASGGSHVVNVKRLNTTK